MKAETALGQRQSKAISLVILMVALVTLAVSTVSAMANTDAMFAQAAGHLLRQDFKAAQETIRDAVGDDALPDAKRLQQSLNAVAGMPEVLLGYFRANIGKELSVTLRDGTKVVRIKAVSDDGRIQADELLRVDGRVAGETPRPFAVADLPVATRAKILAADKSPERTVMLGLLAWSDNKPDAAKKYFAASAIPLGNLLLSRIAEQEAEAATARLAKQREEQSAAAAKAYTDILKIAGVEPLRDDPAKLITAIERTRFTDAQVAEIRRNLAVLDGNPTAVQDAKADKAVLRSIARVRPNVPLEVDQATLAAVLEKLGKDNPKDKLRPDTGFKSSPGELSLSLTQYAFMSDISALAGIPLSSLNISACPSLVDLKPLVGMPLTSLSLSGCPKIADLSPLAGMPLARLALYDLPVSDLGPLKGMPLETLTLHQCIRIEDLRPLEGIPLRHLQVGGGFHNRAGAVTKLSPLRGMPIEKLVLCYNPQLRDLTPLTGMALKHLDIRSTAVDDLRPLRGMPLEELSIPNSVTDTRPVNDIKGLVIKR